MPTNTTRLNLEKPAGADGPIELRNSLTNHATILDNALTLNAGATNIAASQSVSNVAYTPLATADQVTGITLPTNGLLQVWYQATWQESVAGAARAAIFVGSNQAQIAVGSTGTVATHGQAAATNGSGTGINRDQILASFYGGLLSAGRG